MKNGQNKKVVVAMSGGVDSGVAAALLKQQGYFVVGVFMKFWKDGKSGENRCCSAESEKLARLVAKKINIPFYVVNVEKEFKKRVVDYFLKEYKRGNTPNPCVVCNKEIKFGLLIEKALKMGADFVATGHYAKKLQTTNYKLIVARDTNKDQSYFLWQLNQRQLSRTLFPVGNYTKPKVRKLAKKFNLPTAETPESQEVCFIPGTTNDFLKKYLKIKFGKIIDKSGRVLGEHQGSWFYTIGQRKGIGFSGGPYFVVGKDIKKNIIYVGREKDLLSKKTKIVNINWIQKPKKFPILLDVRTRYRAPLKKAELKKNGVLIFKNPERAITPGQSAVFYKGDEIIGGATIDKVI